MQTLFKLSQSEVQEAIQLYIVKKQRAKNVEVQKIAHEADEVLEEGAAPTSSTLVTAHIVVQPRAPRKARGEAVTKAVRAKKA